MTDGDKTIHDIGEKTKKLRVGTEVYVDVRLQCVVTGFNDIGDAVYVDIPIVEAEGVSIGHFGDAVPLRCVEVV